MSHIELYLMDLSSGHPAILGRTTDKDLVEQVSKRIELRHREEIARLESASPDPDPPDPDGILQ